MIKPAKHFSGARALRLQRGIVTWRVGPVDQPDTLRTGKLIRVEGERALVKPSEEACECWMNVADLDGLPTQGPALAKVAPELHPALELPAPVADSLELLGLLDAGVEVQPGQHTVLAGVLGQLRDRGFIVERGAPGSGVWNLTAKGREVIDG